MVDQKSFRLEETEEMAGTRLTW